MRKDRGLWRSAWNNIAFVREPMSANVTAVIQILLGVFGKGWVGPGAWLADAVIHNLIGGEALRAGRATVGVEQGILRKDFLAKAMWTHGSILVLNGRRTIRRDGPMILTRFQLSNSISPNVTHCVPLYRQGDDRQDYGGLGAPCARPSSEPSLVTRPAMIKPWLKALPNSRRTVRGGQQGMG